MGQCGKRVGSRLLVRLLYCRRFLQFYWTNDPPLPPTLHLPRLSLLSRALSPRGESFSSSSSSSAAAAMPIRRTAIQEQVAAARGGCSMLPAASNPRFQTRRCKYSSLHQGSFGNCRSIVADNLAYFRRRSDCSMYLEVFLESVRWFGNFPKELPRTFIGLWRKSGGTYVYLWESQLNKEKIIKSQNV